MRAYGALIPSQYISFIHTLIHTLIHTFILLSYVRRPMSIRRYLYYMVAPKINTFPKLKSLGTSAVNNLKLVHHTAAEKFPQFNYTHNA